MSNESLTDIFGPVISSYSRAQAIEDGVLVEMPPERFDGADLFRFPVAFTAALESAIARGQGSDPDTYRARVWDVCYMATVAVKGASASDVFFKVIVGSRTLSLWGNCGPGDDGAAVMTFGFPEDR
jgi:hypothetical protein